MKRVDPSHATARTRVSGANGEPEVDQSASPVSSPDAGGNPVSRVRSSSAVGSRCPRLSAVAAASASRRRSRRSWTNQSPAIYGEANLSNGFSPDPYSVGMTAGA